MDLKKNEDLKKETNLLFAGFLPFWGVRFSFGFLGLLKFLIWGIEWTFFLGQPEVKIPPWNHERVALGGVAGLQKWKEKVFPTISVFRDKAS